MQPAAYLSLTPINARGMALHWSLEDEALLLADGSVLCFRKELISFLQGYASVAKLSEFAHLTHFWQLVRFARGLGEGAYLKDIAPLWDAYRSYKPKPRTLGVIAATLLRYLGAPPDVPDVDAVVELLDSPRQFEMLCQTHEQLRGADPIEPGVEQVEAHLAGALQGLGQARLDALMQHASQQEEAAPEGVEHPEFDPPTRFSSALDLLFQHERMQGAASYADELMGVVTLPHADDQEESGEPAGFAGFETKGDMSLLTPSAYAADEMEFLRRYAEGELTFFKRERMRVAAPSALVALLDLSARSYGESRLVLSGALRVLAAASERQRRPMLLFTQGLSEPVDPMQLSFDELGALLQTPSLDLNPARLMAELAQDQRFEGARVLLLSGARNLDEAACKEAARALSASCASLAALLTTDDQHLLSGPVRDGRFVERTRFALKAQQRERADAKPVELAEQDTSTIWRGDAEHALSPFQLGVIGKVQASAVDHAGEHMLVVSDHGLLTLFACERDPEHPPRAMLAGVGVLDRVREMIGVRAGFVVMGSIQGRDVIAHYHAGDVRRVRTWELADTLVSERKRVLGYDAKHHAIELGAFDHQAGNSGDLAATSLTLDGDQNSQAQALAPTNQRETEHTALRVNLTDGSCEWIQRATLYAHPQSVNVIERRTADAASEATQPASDQLFHDPALGECMLRSQIEQADAKPLVAQREGEKLLRHAQVRTAKRLGDQLALEVRSREGEYHLCIADLALCRFVRASKLLGPLSALHLLADGRVIALLNEEGLELESASVVEGDENAQRLPRFAPQPLALEASRYWLMMTAADGSTHFVSWEGATLKALHSREARVAEWFLRGSRLGETQGVERAKSISPADLEQASATGILREALELPGGLVALVDHWGRVWLKRAGGELIGALFARGPRLAAWMPDGTCYGPSSITGKAATRFALNRFAEALRES